MALALHGPGGSLTSAVVLGFTAELDRLLASSWLAHEDVKHRSGQGDVHIGLDTGCKLFQGCGHVETLSSAARRGTSRFG